MILQDFFSSFGILQRCAEKLIDTRIHESLHVRQGLRMGIAIEWFVAFGPGLRKFQPLCRVAYDGTVCAGLCDVVSTSPGSLSCALKTFVLNVFFPWYFLRNVLTHN